jgi:two-component system sensor histidine kinase MprB
VSLRTRIAAVAGVTVAVAVLGSAVFAYVAIRSELRSEMDNSLRDTARAFTGLRGREGPPPGGPDGGFPGRGPRDLFDRGERDRRPPAFGGASGYVQLVRGDGQVTRPPNETVPLPVDDRAREIARQGHGEALSDSRVAGTHLRVLTIGVAPDAAVQIARPLDETDRVLHRVLLILVVFGAAGVALAAALGGVIARAALAPIARFTGRTEAIAADPNLSERLEVESQDELGRLAQSFNTTLDALERSVEAQRHLVADASHELRTPIASLRANIQVLEDADRLPPEDLAALRADILEELDELTAIVADVVELARGEKPAEALDDVRLDMVVEALAERTQRRGNGIALDLRLEPTVVAGDPERISRAVSNVLDNALKWSPEDGRIEVTLQDGTLEVRDHGPGFDDADLPHVFERFYRSPKARGLQGSGLGLAIVRQTAEARGGYAEAMNAPGGGALIRVKFSSS